VRSPRALAPPSAPRPARALPPLRPLARAFRLSARALLGLGAGLLAALLAGQLAQLRGALALSDLLRPDTRADALGALGAGLAALGEAALPLSCLLATGLAYARLRAEGAARAWAALGLPPALLLAPALLLGLPCAALSLHLARDVTPRALRDLSPRLARLAAARLARPGPALPLADGGVVRVVAGAAGVEAWAAWPAAGVWARGRLAPAAPATPAAPAAPALALVDVELRAEGAAQGPPALAARLGGLTLRLAPPPPLKSLGPPNATLTHALDPRDPHQAFTAHKRRSLPLSAPLWALLGALLGLRAPAPLALALGALAVGGSYALLRALELRARFEGGDPAWAAWAPVGLLTLALALALALSAPRAARLSAPRAPGAQRR